MQKSHRTCFVKLHTVGVSVYDKFYIIFFENRIPIVSAIYIQLMVVLKATKHLARSQSWTKYSIEKKISATSFLCFLSFFHVRNFNFNFKKRGKPFCIEELDMFFNTLARAWIATWARIRQYRANKCSHNNIYNICTKRKWVTLVIFRCNETNCNQNKEFTQHFLNEMKHMFNTNDKSS